MARCQNCGKDWPAKIGACPDDGGALQTAITLRPGPEGPGLLPNVPTVPSAPPFVLGPGTLIGEYQVEGLLAEGAMGVVYAAHHPLIGKKAAVKVLHPTLCPSADAVERFLQEARAVNQIGHPNVVDVFSFGMLPDGRCYFVMEWLKGESLASRLERGRMAVTEASEIIVQLCRALEAAHARGIVHRDIKPDNVFLVEVPDGPTIVKLLDFGIAKLTDASEESAHRTQMGMTMGTPLYMSPEQARGRGVGPRSDIYGLGVVAFEMLTGRIPFWADNHADIMAMHLMRPAPAARSLCAEVPAALETLLLRMLEKDPSGRPELPEVRGMLAPFRISATPSAPFAVASDASGSLGDKVGQPWALMEMASGSGPSVAGCEPESVTGKSEYESDAPSRYDADAASEYGSDAPCDFAPLAARTDEEAAPVPFDDDPAPSYPDLPKRATKALVAGGLALVATMVVAMVFWWKGVDDGRINNESEAGLKVPPTHAEAVVPARDSHAEAVVPAKEMTVPLPASSADPSASSKSAPAPLSRIEPSLASTPATAALSVIEPSSVTMQAAAQSESRTAPRARKPRSKANARNHVADDDGTIDPFADPKWRQ